jgi:hypothetical protein
MTTREVVDVGGESRMMGKINKIRHSNSSSTCQRKSAKTETENEDGLLRRHAKLQEPSRIGSSVPTILP